MTPQTLSFPSADAMCDAWFFPGTGDHLVGVAGRPVAVMAHGLGGTKDSGLAPFAEALAAAGLHVLAFDYRGFGTSGGWPRQVVSPRAQLQDYRAAMAAAARLDGADARRLVLWGESLAGGTVVAAAADRDDVAAVISVVPLLDGLAAGRHAVGTVPLRTMLLSGALGVAGAFARAAGRRPLTIPLIAGPGRVAALAAPGYAADYQRIAGPSWRNEVAATIAVDVAWFRPGRLSHRVRAPWLVQIADFDRAAPPQSSARHAARGRAEVRHYPCDHFDVQPGRPWHQKAVAHQISFVRRHLAPAP